MRFVCAGTRYKLENNNCATIERMNDDVNSLSRLFGEIKVNSPRPVSARTGYGPILASHVTQEKNTKATDTKKAKKATPKRTRRTKTVKGRGTVERNGMNVERTQRTQRTQRKKANPGFVSVPSTDLEWISALRAHGYTDVYEMRGKTVLKPPPAATGLSRRSMHKTGETRAERRIRGARYKLMEEGRKRYK